MKKVPPRMKQARMSTILCIGSRSGLLLAATAYIESFPAPGAAGLTAVVVGHCSCWLSSCAAAGGTVAAAGALIYGCTDDLKSARVNWQDLTECATWRLIPL